MPRIEMTGPYVYDKAKYHYEGNYPDGLPIEQAFVHTGMFLGWVIDNDLYSERFRDEMGGYVAAFKAREMTGAKVYEECDGVLADDMLNEEGNAFARSYFDFDKGRYIYDYEELLARGLPSTYHVEDTWDNYNAIAERISDRYAEWKLRRARSGARSAARAARRLSN